MGRSTIYGGIVAERLSYHIYLFLSKRTVGPRKAEFQNVNLSFFISTSFNAVFLKSHLLWVIYGPVKKLVFYFKSSVKGAQILNLCKFGRHIDFLFLNQFWWFFFFEIIELERAASSMWTEFLMTFISYGVGDNLEWKGPTNSNLKIWPFLFFIQF